MFSFEKNNGEGHIFISFKFESKVAHAYAHNNISGSLLVPRHLSVAIKLQEHPNADLQSLILLKSFHRCLVITNRVVLGNVYIFFYGTQIGCYVCIYLIYSERSKTIFPLFYSLWRMDDDCG